MTIYKALILKLIGAPPPKGQFTVSWGGKSNPALRFPLRRTFHYGFLDWHARAPAKGRNPFFDEYAGLLADGPDLRFLPPGVGGDHDSRGSESHKLGRTFARATLADHFGYRWFGHVSNLLDKGPNPSGWSVESAEAGDSPDWILAKSGSGQFGALAEAKGRSKALPPTSGDLKKWKDQLGRVHVKCGPNIVSLKNWIVASRWVTTSQPKTWPVLYVDDPESLGRRPQDDEASTYELWVASHHTADNLFRIGQFALADRLRRQVVQEENRVRVQTWMCDAPGLKNRFFIGRSLISIEERACPLFLLGLDDLGLGNRLTGPERDALERHVAQLRGLDLFDGVELGVVKHLLHQQLPPLVEVANLPPDVSLLNDGSLISPLARIEPGPAFDL